MFSQWLGVISRLIERDPPIALVVKVFFLLTYDRCDLHLPERPMHDKLLHLDCFRVFVHGKHDPARIGHGFLCGPSLCYFFSNYGPDDILSHICGREVFPS